MKTNVTINVNTKAYEEFKDLVWILHFNDHKAEEGYPDPDQILGELMADYVKKQTRHLRIVK